MSCRFTHPTRIHPIAEFVRRSNIKKGDDESVGEAIDRLLGSRPLGDAWGAWCEETADRTRRAIGEGRVRTDE